MTARCTHLIDEGGRLGERPQLRRAIGVVVDGQCGAVQVRGVENREAESFFGLTDGDFVGVTNYTGDVGAYPDGAVGFQMSDCDGAMRVIFDTVDLSTSTDPAVDQFDAADFDNPVTILRFESCRFGIQHNLAH